MLLSKVWHSPSKFGKLTSCVRLCVQTLNRLLCYLSGRKMCVCVCVSHSIVLSIYSKLSAHHIVRITAEFNIAFDSRLDDLLNDQTIIKGRVFQQNQILFFLDLLSISVLYVVISCIFPPLIYFRIVDIDFDLRFSFR